MKKPSNPFDIPSKAFSEATEQMGGAGAIVEEDWESGIDYLIQWETRQHEKDVKDFIRHLRLSAYEEGRKSMDALVAKEHNEGFKEGYMEGSEDSADASEEGIAEGRKKEREAWLAGERCENCGEEMTSKELTGTCAKCWEEA